MEWAPILGLAALVVAFLLVAFESYKDGRK